jgi:hypothetical protein
MSGLEQTMLPVEPIAQRTNTNDTHEKQGNEAERPEWLLAHRELSAVARRRAELDCIEAACLLRAERARVHRHMGLATFAEYAERLLGYTPRTLEEKLRVARALERLPETERALASGRINASVARELTRVATAETERAWLDAAAGQTVRQVQHLVSGHAPGDLPSDAKKAHLQRFVLHFEVRSDTYAAFREALKVLRQRSDHSLDDDAALLQMAREVLGGPSEAGRANYQLVVSTCEECGRGFQRAAGDRVEIDPAVVAAAACDAVEIAVPAGAAGIGVEPADTGPTGAHARAADGSREGAHVCAEADTGAPTDSPRRRRARQTVPPAVRREVLHRDQGCCVVPGCRNTTFVDVHHLVTRAEGGSNRADNLVVNCGAHHRAVHEGTLRIEGSVVRGLSFLHIDRTSYGSFPGFAQDVTAESEDDGTLDRVPQRAECEAPSSEPASPPTPARDRALVALKHLGFTANVAKDALERAVAELSENASTEELLRAAIRAAT